jgi:hypothetical protein
MLVARSPGSVHEGVTVQGLQRGGSVVEAGIGDCLGERTRRVGQDVVAD